MTIAGRSHSPYAAAALGLGSAIAFLLAVEILIRSGWINRFIVPLPSEILASVPRIIREEHVLQRFLETAREAVIACALVSISGVCIGAILHKLRLLRAATESWVAALASAPIVLLYPLFLVVFGRNAVTIIMIGVVAALPPMILKTLEGLSAVREVLVDVGHSFRLTPAQSFWKILLPSALPSIFVGVRLGLIFALINIVGVEFLINFGGLGQLINELAERYDLAGTYAAIGFVILVSVCVFLTTERLERWLIRAP